MIIRKRSGIRFIFNEGFFNKKQKIRLLRMTGSQWLSSMAIAVGRTRSFTAVAPLEPETRTQLESSGQQVKDKEHKPAKSLVESRFPAGFPSFPSAARFPGKLSKSGRFLTLAKMQIHSVLSQFQFSCYSLRGKIIPCGAI